MIQVHLDEFSSRERPVEIPFVTESLPLERSAGQLIQPERISRKWADLKVIGQLHQTYLVTQDSEGMELIDQHAAHERVMFERLQSRLRGEALEMQNFLFPIALEMNPEVSEWVMGRMADFRELGIELDWISPQQVGVVSAWSGYRDSAIHRTFSLISKEVSEHGVSFAFDRLKGDVIATLACHSAIRAGQSLSMEEMRSLLVEMDLVGFSSFCPHGRPVSIAWSLNQLERSFGRIL